MKALGQYFTPEPVAQLMVDLVECQDMSAFALEPSCGEGIFIDLMLKKGFRRILGYEIDKKLAQRHPVLVEYKSFVSNQPSRKPKIVIGNPPYVRWRNLTETAKKELCESPLWNEYFNSLCDYLYIFILKSVELLEDQGELIFITPSYWFSTTHAQTLRDYLVERGSFSSIHYFHEIKIFEQVASSLVVFRYVKGRSPTPIELSHYEKDELSPSRQETIAPFEKGKRWTLASGDVQLGLAEFENRCDTELGEIADIGNGMVSGLDAAFQIPDQMELNDAEKLATISVVKAKQTRPYQYLNTTRYIFVKEGLSEREFLENYPNFAKLLEPYKERLSKRYSYNRDVKYWEWVFLRNYRLLLKDQHRIFIPCKERITSKNYFRFCIADMNTFSTQDVTAILLKDNIPFPEGIFYLLAYLNSKQVFNWVKFKGIVKGGVVEFSEKPLSIIPIRRINWFNPQEERLWQQIVDASALAAKHGYSYDSIQPMIDELFSIAN